MRYLAWCRNTDPLNVSVLEISISNYKLRDLKKKKVSTFLSLLSTVTVLLIVSTQVS
jgi:hypothetical protein